MRGGSKIVMEQQYSQQFPPSLLPGGVSLPWDGWLCSLLLQHASLQQTHQMLKAFVCVQFCRLLVGQRPCMILFEQVVIEDRVIDGGH